MACVVHENLELPSEASLACGSAHHPSGRHDKQGTRRRRDPTIHTSIGSWRSQGDLCHWHTHAASSAKCAGWWPLASSHRPPEASSARREYNRRLRPPLLLGSNWI